MRILPRTEFGNPILRKRAKNVPLSSLKTKAFKTLTRDMVYTMRRAQGVGLAAPQIGKSLRLVVIEIRPTRTRPNLKSSGSIIVINPRIVRSSRQLSSDWEGCLSFEGTRGRVPRSRSVVVEYMNELGQKQKIKASGLMARIFAHEIDHLNGVTYTDRIKDMKTLMTVEEFATRILKIKL
jgi:peptide deformylase